MLGPDEPKVKRGRALIRLASPRYLHEILSQLKINPKEVIKKPIADGCFVLGPTDSSVAEKLCRQELISSRDTVQLEGDRWKAFDKVFPDVDVAQLTESELTATFTATEAIDSTHTTTIEELTETGELSHEEVPKVENPSQKSEGIKKPVTPPPKEALDEILLREERTDKIVVKKQEDGVSRGVKTTREADRSLFNSKWLLYPGVFLILGAILVYWSPWKSNQLSNENDADIGSHLDSQYSDFPSDLQPISFSDLHSFESGAPAKLRPVLNDYERGVINITDDDFKLLKRMASPASASRVGKVLANNQLGILALSKRRTEEAARYFRSAMRIDPNDVVSILNSSLLSLVQKDFDRARDYAGRALRICDGYNCWLTKTVLALIEGYDENLSRAEAYLRQALNESTQKMLIYGLWLKILSLNSDVMVPKVKAVLNRLLWSNPDASLDAPIPAPFASHLLLLESTEGIVFGRNFSRAELNTGEKDYLKWVIARQNGNPLTEPIDRVSQELAKDYSARSQVLLAYTYQQMDRFEKAAEILTQTLPLITDNDFVGSWPWSFAGDIQLQRGFIDEASILYKSALRRNILDVVAVYGLGQILREKKDFDGARQRFAETLNIDANFVPARLRVSRTQWHEEYWQANR